MGEDGGGEVSEHELKTLPRYWDAIADGRKTFEVRRNDRAFQTGDILALVKLTESGISYDLDHAKPFLERKRIIRKRITYLLQGGQFGIEPAYCVLGLGEP